MVFVFGRSEPSFDEQVFDVGRQFQRISVGDDDIGSFAEFECANLAAQAKNLRWINCDSAQRSVVRQAMRDSIGGILPEAPRERVVEAGDRELHARGSKLGGLR